MHDPEPAMPAARNRRAATILFGGDVMLGRLVADAIRAHGPQWPLGALAPLMRAADLAVVNLECAITASTRRWAGAPKAFYFGAPPQAVAALTGAGVDVASVANNHLLDFGLQGMQDTLAQLRASGIAYAGAGEDSAEAAAPVLFSAGGLSFGMAAFCDHQADFAAAPGRPGIAYLDLRDEAGALARLRTALAPLLRAQVDWPILSLHWGPNMVERPSDSFRRIAHAAVRMGWRILFGHSAHVFHGVELVQGCPLLYAAGDLVDDYYVDPDLRNDRQLLFELHLAGRTLARMVLHPVFISECRVREAGGADYEAIAARATRLCAELGSRVRRDGQLLLEV